MKKYLIITCLALAVLSAWLAQSLVRANEEKTRLQNNQEALMSECKLYETKAGESAASVLRLQPSCPPNLPIHPLREWAWLALDHGSWTAKFPGSCCCPSGKRP